MSQPELRIGFIGGGNMAHAIVGGLVRGGHAPGSIAVADPDDSARRRIAAIDESIEVTDDVRRVAADARILVLAVKPQIISAVAAEVADAVRPAAQLVISIAAGTTLSSLASHFGTACPIVRVMPNQPALVGEGMSVLLASPAASDDDRRSAEYVAAATGRTAWIDDEALMDVVTAVSGSGPAYFYLVMEILAEWAQDCRLPPDQAQLLARQTALGAAAVAMQTESGLADLRKTVTSKGGTTEAALRALDAGGFRDILRTALEAARDRSIELGSADGDAKRS